MVAQLASELGDARRASAVEAFEALGVCKQLAEAAASLGWQSPSEIQAQSIPIVLKGVGVGRVLPVWSCALEGVAFFFSF